MLSDDVTLLVNDEYDRNLSRAACGKETNWIGCASIVQYSSINRAKPSWIQWNGVFTTTLVHVFDRFLVPSTVGKYLEGYAGFFSSRFPIVHVLFDVFLYQMAVTAVSSHEVKDDHAATVVIEVKPSRLVNEICFNTAAVERFKHKIRDGSRFCIGLEQFIHAVEHRQGGK